MRHIFLWGALAVAIGAAVACGDSATDPGADPGTDPGDSGASAALPPSSAGTGAAGTGGNTGLPCDVQAVLENRCLACHSGSSPPPLLTYAQLMAKSTANPTKTLAQLSLARMKSTTSPMPPPPAVPPDAEEIATFAAWVNAGTPKGQACTAPPPDAGAPDAGDGGTTATVCTSKTTWKDDNDGSQNMRPGGACQTCHQIMGGPAFRFAGTVYPTAHEPNDCNGKGPPPTLTVVVTDKNNKVTNITVNSVGNFNNNTKNLTPPYSVKVTDGTKTRAMVGTITAGDCNSCHTVAGANGAPGRIMAP